MRYSWTDIAAVVSNRVPRTQRSVKRCAADPGSILYLALFWVPALRGSATRRTASGTRNLPRDLLDARDQLVDGFLDRHLLADDAVHRLRPHILVVENRELVVLGKIKRLCAAGELVVDGLAVTVGLPERALLTFDRRREPAAECTLDIGAEVFFLKQEGDELFRLG